MSDQLLRLSQGASTISDYTLQFCTLAATSGWNEAALLSSYHHGLNPNIRAAMSIYDDMIGLENFKKPPAFHNAYRHASPMKPLASLHHPPSVLQYQSPCSWIPPVLLARNGMQLWLDSASTVLITSSRTVPSDPHALQ